MSIRLLLGTRNELHIGGLQTPHSPGLRSLLRLSLGGYEFSVPAFDVSNYLFTCNHNLATICDDLPGELKIESHWRSQKCGFFSNFPARNFKIAVCPLLVKRTRQTQVGNICQQPAEMLRSIPDCLWWTVVRRRSLQLRISALAA